MTAFIPLTTALEILRRERRANDIVIPTMGSAREWMKLGDPHPLDFVLVPSAMGHGTSIGLGLALARPDHRVVVCMGDGSLLMNLGSLASIVASGASNLVVIVFDNGVYEVTGQQPTAGASAARSNGTAVDFVGVARACGFESVHHVETTADWSANARHIMNAKGPTFVALNVEPVVGGTAPHSPGPTVARARAFRAALGERPAR
jgi:phosphonopyruvate decarboxylase